MYIGVYGNIFILVNGNELSNKNLIQIDVKFSKMLV